ncbi:MAG: MFS transporter [Moritella sp.]|uniref:peptide MFS transporter n=1 Tax=unclassified Moritella TaxID=2637987 RepID=UPI0001569B1B|nr:MULTISPECIES: peptide MFS transporter [unclassified Moritella]EDM66369.1 putative dipeptide/Tripeptide permease [Moritella sp. PE36]MBL1415280.1 peptide MFS transporter [Moritella sp.]PHR86405.1 MAG: MFS transporter [Moritella sp.]
MNPNNSDTFMGHPKGLFLLFSTEMMERFSYYGMRAILVLFLVSVTQDQQAAALLTDPNYQGGIPGLGWTQADALSLYGTYTGLVYITPLIGGWLADNFLGQRKSVIIGGVLMAIGQFLLFAPLEVLAFSTTASLYLGLAFLIAGNGLFKPNISTMVGDLYEEGDNRRDGAFTIFYMGINIGAFLSGILVGAVVVYTGDYKYGFLMSGIAMVLSVVLQKLFANKYLGSIGIEAAAKKERAANKGKKQTLTAIEVDRIKVILILGLFVIIFWAGFEQAGGLMNLYANDYTDRMIGSFEVPVAWFQSLNPFFIITCAPIVSMIWIKMGPKEPTSPVKFAMALLMLAIGFVFMIFATLEQGGDLTVKTSMYWLVGAYFFHTMGELCLSPIGLSMITKLAPLRLASLMMGAWFGFNAIANKVAGMIGAQIGEAGPMAIFGGIAIAAVISSLILFASAHKLIYWMHGAEGKVITKDDTTNQKPVTATA